MFKLKSMKDWLKIIKEAFAVSNNKFQIDDAMRSEAIERHAEDCRYETFELNLKRKKKGKDCTFGTLYNKNRVLCFTLEDPVREHKIPKITAIQEGRYEVVMQYSPKFQCRLPTLLNVPNFTYIRIHAGNRAEDTDGCILVGNAMRKNVLFDSRNALRDVLQVITKAISEKKRVFLTIENDFLDLTKKE